MVHEAPTSITTASEVGAWRARTSENSGPAASIHPRGNLCPVGTWRVFQWTGSAQRAPDTSGTPAPPPSGPMCPGEEDAAPILRSAGRPRRPGHRRSSSRSAIVRGRAPCPRRSTRPLTGLGRGDRWRRWVDGASVASGGRRSPTWTADTRPAHRRTPTPPRRAHVPAEPLPVDPHGVLPRPSARARHPAASATRPRRDRDGGARAGRRASRTRRSLSGRSPRRRQHAVVSPEQRVRASPNAIEVRGDASRAPAR